MRDACDSQGRCSGTLLSRSVCLTFLALASSSCCPLSLPPQAFGSQLTRTVSVPSSCAPVSAWPSGAGSLLPQSLESPGGAIAQGNALRALPTAQPLLRGSMGLVL